MKKLVLNISDAPTWTKVIPFVGFAGGIALAKYMKKDCWGCFAGFSLIGLLATSIPLGITAKNAGDKIQIQPVAAAATK